MMDASDIECLKPHNPLLATNIVHTAKKGMDFLSGQCSENKFFPVRRRRLYAFSHTHNTAFLHHQRSHTIKFPGIPTSRQYW